VGGVSLTPLVVWGYSREFGEVTFYWLVKNNKSADKI